MKLTGSWYNELNSRMSLTVDGASVTGTYESAVGAAKGVYPLVGRTERSPDGSQSVAFVVVWDNDVNGNLGCCTAWAGQLHVDARGRESIIATWLLSGDTVKEDDWKATKVGQDIFLREPRSATVGLEGVARAPSHP